MPRVIELDFGMGNIRSLQKAFEHLGQKVEVTSDYKLARQADVLILPGDGAFGKAMQELRRLHLDEVIYDFVRSKKPLLGICIGFQLLLQESEEFGKQQGLALLEGEIESFRHDGDLEIPHIGWNPTSFVEGSLLGKGLAPLTFFYYVHSYRLGGKHSFSAAMSRYGKDFTAVIEKENIFATQFHPEKSHSEGLQVLRNFLEAARCF